MTTAAEVKQIVGSYPREAQRVVLKPSGLLLSEEGRDALAKEIVALANRDGGRLVLGVDEQGRFESSLELSHDDAVAAMAQLATSRIVPPLEPALEHLSGEEGDLLVIGVPRRAAGPHAFARVSARGSVAGRAYFVRHGAQTRPVSDAQLAWMFRVVDDPAVRRSMTLTLYTRPGLLLLSSELPQPRAADRFAGLVADLDVEQQSVLANDEGARATAFVELAGWAFLREVGALLGDQAELAATEVSLDDLPVPGAASVFSAHPGGLRGLLGGATPATGLRSLLRRQASSATMLVPQGCEVQVDYLAHQRKTRVVLTHEAFVVTLTAVADGGGDGLGWPGREGQMTGQVCWSRLRLEYACSLPFPAAERKPTATAGFLARLQRRLEFGWNSERFLDAFSGHYLERLVSDQAASAGD